jgi:glycosyltransferase involved in cell wall biosynthesis
MEGEFYFCPLKILDYCAAGCAVVASDQGDIPRLLDGGRTGKVLKSGDLTLWTSAVTELVRNPAESRRIGDTARQWILSEYTWRRTAERVLSVLNQVIESSKTQTSALIGEDSNHLQSV